MKKHAIALWCLLLSLSLLLGSCALPPLASGGLQTPPSSEQDGDSTPDNEGENGSTDKGESDKDESDNTESGGNKDENNTTTTPPDNGNTDGDTDDGKDEDTVTATDPYVNITKAEFYASYTPAKDYMDAYYRTKHGLMSGEIETPAQAPNIAPYRPSEDGKYIRNNAPKYEDEGNTFILTDAYGNKVKKIYKDGAYITIEEVAAYVYAFGDVPKNYVSSKKTKPSESIFGEYLRLNHSSFSGDTAKYPYEPVLPRISGCGGDLKYYEIDIGTTGTDCDPSYAATIYNNGSRITRGAARIVYARFHKNGNAITNPDIRFVFYTYNHYNDFQEYLGYEGGFGKMFGNITGGGTISSKTNYNPTPYVPTVLKALSAASTKAKSLYTIAPMDRLNREDDPFMTFEEFLTYLKGKEKPKRFPSKYQIKPQA